MTGQLFDYDIAADSWSASAVDPSIPDRIWYEAVELDGWIYFMGGSTAFPVPTTNEVNRYNPATTAWETVAPMNYNRALAMSWVYDGMIYVAGGFDDYSDLASTEVYDPTTDTWTESAALFAPLPQTWWGAGDAIKHGDQLWLAGGYNTAWTDETLWWYAADNTWYGGPPLAEVASQVEMDNQLGDLYVVGGYRDAWLDYNQHLVQCGVPPEGRATDAAGVGMDVYTTDEIVYATGTGFPPNSDVDVHIVGDLAWSDGDAIPPDVSGGVETVTTDGNGDLGPAPVWQPLLTPGEYDMVFDANQNGVYNAGTDVVDDPNHPGFIVIAVGPKPIGGIIVPMSKVELLAPYMGLAALLSLVALTVALVRRRRG
jgi:hypothetical protein